MFNGLVIHIYITQSWCEESFFLFFFFVIDVVNLHLTVMCIISKSESRNGTSFNTALFNSYQYTCQIDLHITRYEWLSGNQSIDKYLDLTGEWRTNRIRMFL